MKTSAFNVSDDLQSDLASQASPLAIAASEDGSSIGAIAGAASSAVDAADSSAGESVRLSYKFQRLREKLREAIATGELSGRLPGERQLARKFRVNAKTLSKALTDLAAEGLLDRSIGRGTFVRGTELPATATADKWLIICDADQAHWASIQALQQANPEAHVVVGMPEQRPSFLNPFKAAVIFSKELPDAFVRDLVVRNLNVVIAGREPGTFSTHAVLADRSLGATCIAREMMLGGHRKFLAVEMRGSTQVVSAIRQTAARYAPDAVVEAVFASDVEAALGQQGATAIICDSFDSAILVRKTLDDMGLHVPSQVSLAAVGFGNTETRCSGYLISPELETQSILELLRDTASKRPTTLWLAAKAVEHGTVGPVPVGGSDASQLRYDVASA